jgi:hypothetical protein
MLCPLGVRTSVQSRVSRTPQLHAPPINSAFSIIAPWPFPLHAPVRPNASRPAHASGVLAATPVAGWPVTTPTPWTPSRIGKKFPGVTNNRLRKTRSLLTDSVTNPWRWFRAGERGPLKCRKQAHCSNKQLVHKVHLDMTKSSLQF